MCVGRPEEFAALCHAMIDSGTVPDFITIDGGEGGTGAAPAEFQDSLGMPARDGLRFINSMLIGCNLRDQVKLIVAGKVRRRDALADALPSVPAQPSRIAAARCTRALRSCACWRRARAPRRCRPARVRAVTPGPPPRTQAPTCATRRAR